MGKLREKLNDLDGGNCALPLALEAMGERWSFMILRAAFNGVHHFEEFQQELNIARNILSNRLSKLVDHGIMAREVMAEDRRKVLYQRATIPCRGARNRCRDPYRRPCPSPVPPNRGPSLRYRR